MGNDGGTSAIQRSLVVRLRKRESNQNTRERYHQFWSICHYSDLQLTPHRIVACRKGLLYDKEQILSALLEKTFQKSGNEIKLAFGHIRKLSDIVNVHFEINPDYKEENSYQTKWICAVSRKPIEGSQTCYLIRKCGHVVNQETWNNLILKPFENSQLSLPTDNNNSHPTNVPTTENNGKSTIKYDDSLPIESNEQNILLPTLTPNSLSEIPQSHTSQTYCTLQTNQNSNIEIQPKCLVCGATFNIQQDVTMLSPLLSSFDRHKMLSGSKRKREHSDEEKKRKKK